MNPDYSAVYSGGNNEFGISSFCCCSCVLTSVCRRGQVGIGQNIHAVQFQKINTNNITGLIVAAYSTETISLLVNSL